MARRRPKTRTRTRPHSSTRTKASLLSLLLLFAVLGIADYLDTGSLRLPGGLQLLAEQAFDSLEQATSDAPQDPAPDTALRGQATRITDGDTFTLRYSSTEDERVRLHGIDAPERAQPHGSAAGAALASLIEGREVRVEVVDRDNYGRLVGRIWVDDLDVNLAMVRDGHAWWYEYYAKDRHDLEQAEDAARRAQRGLWAQRNPIPPWEWRRNRR